MPSRATPMPTVAEAEILAALWRLGPATVREVHEALQTSRDYNTTLTQMRLMIDKGLLTRSERYRSHLYAPATPKAETQTRLARDLLKRAFDGSAKGLVLSALGAQPTTPEEREEIRGMLDRLDKKEGQGK